MPNLTTVAATATKLNLLTAQKDAAQQARANLYPFNAVEAAAMDARIDEIETQRAAAQAAYEAALAG